MEDENIVHFNPALCKPIKELYRGHFEFKDVTCNECLKYRDDWRKRIFEIYPVGLADLSIFMVDTFLLFGRRNDR